jgi:hypothetical protein
MFPYIACSVIQDEKYVILEPVSIGGWRNIWLRRITRSSTCVCLKLRNVFHLFCSGLRAHHARPVPPVYSRALCSFSRFALARDGCAKPIACCARGSRSPRSAERAELRPTPYLHRIFPISICANFGPDRPSRLAAYTGQHNTGQRPF